MHTQIIDGLTQEDTLRYLALRLLPEEDILVMLFKLNDNPRFDLPHNLIAQKNEANIMMIISLLNHAHLKNKKNKDQINDGYDSIKEIV